METQIICGKDKKKMLVQFDPLTKSIHKSDFAMTAINDHYFLMFCYNVLGSALNKI